MGDISHLIGYLFHLDKHLTQIVHDFGSWTYLFLFLIIFIETGLVAMPFLPGDSLLFIVGTFAAMGSLDMSTVLMILVIAAVSGDSVNYAIGKFLGPKVFFKKQSRFFKKEYLERAERFYARYGAKAIVLGRFIPIIRTFVPFVAGIGSMDYRKFLFYNILGGTLWVGGFVSAGYFFGNMPVVKNNFSLVIMMIIFLSILPGVLEVWRNRLGEKST